MLLRKGTFRPGRPDSYNFALCLWVLHFVDFVWWALKSSHVVLLTNLFEVLGIFSGFCMPYLWMKLWTLWRYAISDGLHEVGWLSVGNAHLFIIYFLNDYDNVLAYILAYQCFVLFGRSFQIEWLQWTSCGKVVRWVFPDVMILWHHLCDYSQADTNSDLRN